MAFLLQSAVSFAQEKDSTVVALEKIVAEAPNDSLKVSAYLTLGDYQLRRDFNSVSAYLNEARKIIKSSSKKYNSELHEAEILQQSGLIQRRRANYSEALRDYYKALKIFEKYNDSIGLASSCNNIGNVLIYQKEFEKAKKILRKAITINTKLKRPRSIGHNYNILSRAYKDDTEIDSLKYFFDKTLTHYKEANYEEGVHQVMSNIGNLYVREKRYEEALELQLKNLAYVTKIGKKTAIAASHYNITKIYISLKEYDKALFHINTSLNIAKTEKMGRRYFLSFRRRSLIYNNLKDYYNALEDYRRYSKARDSILNLDKIKEIREIELSYAFEKERYMDSIQFTQEKDVLMLKTENESLQKKWYLALLIITLFIIVAIVYFGSKYFKKLRLRKQLEAQQLNTKIDQLSTEISSKKEEISELVAETIIHLNTKEKITENLNKLSKQEEGISLTGILAELKADKLEDGKLVLLKENIETLNYEFLKRLREKHSNLTKTDIEVCSFIKLGLSRKEISELRKTSLEAIKSTRFRLKKKLNLSAQDSLDDFINSI
ncbi:tetratricopeptide repeat protein [uncultured Kordia sp.]|uniref:tetratricopeptide repeat protein n=1 Tax=uncultured Kordia sp. TaxID=507699 RepID=UPI0026071616|nr:tetratricopeptide repeat protein [uncultured Kordia sp.]